MEGKGKYIFFGCLGLGCFTSLCAGALLFVMLSQGKFAKVPGSSPIPASPQATRQTPPPARTTPMIRTSRFQFTDEAGQIDTGGDYGSGEKIYYVFFVEGVTRDQDGQWNLRVHLKVAAPNGEVILDKNVVNQPGDIEGPLRISGYVELSQGAPAGTYTIETTTEDLVSGEVLPETRSFRVQG